MQLPVETILNVNVFSNVVFITTEEVVTAGIQDLSTNSVGPNDSSNLNWEQVIKLPCHVGVGTKVPNQSASCDIVKEYSRVIQSRSLHVVGSVRLANESSVAQVNHAIYGALEGAEVGALEIKEMSLFKRRRSTSLGIQS
ncbi:hypothetical protein V6N13_121676 [Hibiscus sabdariffa]